MVIMVMPELRQVVIVSDHYQDHSRDGDSYAFVMNLIARRVLPYREREEQTASLIEAFTRLQVLARRPSTRIAIKVNGRILFINPGDVVAVLAEGNYVSLQQQSSSYLLRESISLVADKLQPFGFIRIHRSVLINTAFVEEIKPYPTGEYGLRVKGGKEYRATRTYKENLKSLAEFCIGTGGFFLDREQ
jgi:two-component system, LytTR family, response regulator